MNTSAVVLLVAAVLVMALVDADVFMQKVTEHADHPGECYDSRSNKFYKSGEKWYVPGFCYELKCGFPYIKGYGADVLIRRRYSKEPLPLPAQYRLVVEASEL